MIVYLFNDIYFNKINLPVKINGVYPLYLNNRVFLGNIEEVDGSWKLSLAENIVYDTDVNHNIENYSNFLLRDVNTESIYYVYILPIYDTSVNCYEIKSDKFTIGKTGCDINYNCNFIDNKNVNLSYVNNRWNVKTDANCLFVSGTRGNDINLFNGDYIFYYGLKILFLNKYIIINNTNLVTLSPNVFVSTQLSNTCPVNSRTNIDDDIPLFSKDDYYFKSPRFNSTMEDEKVFIDEPPDPITPSETPVILTLGPRLTMLCTSVISLVSYINSYLEGTATKSRFIMSLATILVMIVGTLVWPSITRIYNDRMAKKKEKKRQEKYKEYLLRKRHEIELIKTKQRQIIMEDAPSLENCKLIIETKPRTLWQRNIENDDFLLVRLGIGNVNSKIKIDMPREQFSLADEDNLFSELQNVISDSRLVKGAPLTVNLVESNITAIVGNPMLVKQFIDGVFLQIMTFHAYTDLKIIVYTKNENKWDYLKILPHCWDNQKSIRYFTTNLDELGTVTIDLEKIFDARVEKDESVQKDNDGSEDEEKDLYKNYKPYYLIFTDDINAIRNVSLIKKILKYKKNLGFSMLMFNDRLSTLPSETSTFINIDQPISGLVTNELAEDNQKQFTAEIDNSIDIYDCAQKLANIPINVEKAKYELPTSLSFLEMYGVGKVEQLNISEKWSNNNPVNSLSVPIGVDQNGELFKMDIHEKAYGPHGLVAGTTGSGKSEWIITYILSLAINFNPDEVQFVLIDYKGGGLALSFENSEMGIKLPHLAGTITNLDKSAINRSIASLESELKRRQSVFNDAREKLKEGSMNIYKYQQFYRKGLVSEPMSHLLIICDEFAELKQQQPEFMDQLISISRIGRSLGVHLILATQKPSGVVNDQIWSNSKFKVCLKVQDKGDSNEILKKPDAAFLKQTGAFYLEVGNDDYYNLGQSAWAGAKYYPSDVLKKKIDQSVQYIDNIGRTINVYDDIDVNAKKEDKGEQLLNIVQYIDSIVKKENYVGRQLWLPNVPSVSYISDLVKKYNHKAESYNYNTPIGEYDEPRRQEQGLLEIDLEKGNVAIIGQTGSGKENLISTILWSSIIEHTPYEINHYIVDFGSETLKKFAKFPHVGEVIFQSDMDRFAELVDLIDTELETRKELLSDYNGSFEYYNKTSDKKLPLIVFTINAYDVLLELVPKVADVFLSLFRDAPRYGIVMIVSTSTNTVLRSRQLQYFNHIIMLQMQDESLYRSVTNCRRDLLPSKIFGRGICKIGVDDDSYCEFQTAFIAEESQAYEFIKNTANQLTDYYKVKAKQLAKIPDTVTSEDLVKYVTDLSAVPIGFNFYEKDIAKYSFIDNKINIITCKDVKNNMKFIYGLVNILSKQQNVKVRVVDMLGIFKKPILDIKLFNDGLNEVIGALENDVLTRNETQDFGINIILGAGQYKKKLSKGGVEIFDNMFNKLPNSKKVIFILIDDYDKIRTLKLESWYSNINTGYGLWLGNGFSSQSMISSGELSQDDKKYNFEGLAYSVTNSNYTVIKTILDGDE